MSEALGYSVAWPYECARMGLVARLRLGSRLIAFLLDDAQALVDPEHRRTGLDTLDDAFPGRTFVSVGEAAWSLGVSYCTILRAVRSGELPASRRARNASFKIRRQDLVAFLRRNREPARREVPR